MSLFFRMITEDQNLEEQHPEEQLCYEFIFMLFKEKKVEIAGAILKPFPFLMGLRDRGFISEPMYQVSEGNSLLITRPTLSSAKFKMQ